VFARVRTRLARVRTPHRSGRKDGAPKSSTSLPRIYANAFPDMQGFSPRNLSYMRALAEAWPGEAIVQEPLAQLTWYHNLTILERVRDRSSDSMPARQSNTAGAATSWSSRSKSGLYGRQGKAITNFHTTLPPPQTDRPADPQDPYTSTSSHSLRKPRNGTSNIIELGEPPRNPKKYTIAGGCRSQLARSLW
jgi:hypothetical protein